MQRIKWLALGYNAPAEPSKNRVYVWRKLKEFGASYFRPGVAILPDSPENANRFKWLASKIKEMGGEAVIAELKFCDARDETETIERFKKQSKEEYNELMSVVRGVIGSAPPARRDEQLKKLLKHYGKVRSRDFFSSRDSFSQGLIDLADDIELVAAGFGRQLRNLLELY